MRLLAKVTLIVLAGAALTTVAAIVFVSNATQSILQTVIEKQQSELGAQIMDKIDRLLFNYQIGIQNIGEEEHIERTLGGELKDPQVIERRIKELPFLTGPWDFLEIVNASSDIVISNTQLTVSTGTVPEQDPDNLTALREALSGRVYYSNFIISKRAGKPTMVFAAPIRDQEKPNSPIVGAVVGQMAWPAVDEILQSEKSAGELDLYTYDGTLIATNNEKATNLFSKSEDAAKEIQGVFAETSSRFSVGTAAGDDFEALTTRSPSRGFLVYKGNQWALFIEIPTSIAFAPVAQAARNVAFLLLIIIFLTGVLILALLRQIVVRPVMQLIGIARAITAGDLTKRAEVGSRDEIGELAEAFNAMTSKVQESYAALAKDQAQLLASINSLSLGFIMMDVHENTIVTNQAAKALFRTPQVTLDSMAKGFGNAADIAGSYRRVIESKTHFEIGEALLGDKFFRILLTPIFLGETNWEIIGSVILLEDVTEQKRLEQSKGAFIAIASHEMRTPLTVIRGNAELLVDDDMIRGNPDIKAQIESILRSAIRLLGVVNDFLDIQNLEESKIALKIEPVDVIKTLGDTVADLSMLAKEKGLSLVFDPSSTPAIPVLNLDRYRLQQIFINLISNAIHYTEKGKITVNVEMQNDNMKVYFNDTGIGMGPEERTRLFKKFQTGNVFLHSKEYGSGLGLYISKFLARLMGGDLTLEKSEPGIGSTFCLAFPLGSQTGARATDEKRDVDMPKSGL